MDNHYKKSQIIDGIQEIILDSWKEFINLSVESFTKTPAYVYRGQANYNWQLISSMTRLQKRYPRRKNLGGNNPPYFECPPLTKNEQLTAFKYAIRGRRGPNPSELTDDEYWTLGQHHGLATPLLDWTRSPYIALFFAFEEEECNLSSNVLGAPDYRGVYALSTSTIDTMNNDDINSLKMLATKTDSNYRLINQCGVLIKIPLEIDIESLIKKNFRGEVHGATLAKVKIPNEDRESCLIALNKMNINRMVLFPDIDGAAKYVNSLWQPGHENLIQFL